MKGGLDFKLEVKGKKIGFVLTGSFCKFSNTILKMKALIKEAGFEVIYSVHCGIAMKNGVPNLRMSHIELLDFGLWWKKGKFYQHENERSNQ